MLERKVGVVKPERGTDCAHGGSLERTFLAGLRPRLNNKKLSRSSRFEDEKTERRGFRDEILLPIDRAGLIGVRPLGGFGDFRTTQSFGFGATCGRDGPLVTI